MNQEAAEYKAKVQERLGEKFGILAGDMERVRAAGTIDAALKVGELAPEFTLPDAFGKPVSFSALLARGPVVISFYRGEWCPFCNIEMRAPVLSDFGNQVARQFGIVFQIGQELKEFSKNVFKNDIALRNGEESYELPVPATYVIDTIGVIRFAHVDVDYMTDRAEPGEVISALKAIAYPVNR
jgi:peroxiredoxin